MKGFGLDVARLDHHFDVITLVFRHVDVIKSLDSFLSALPTDHNPREVNPERFHSYWYKTIEVYMSWVPREPDLSGFGLFFDRLMDGDAEESCCFLVLRYTPLWAAAMPEFPTYGMCFYFIGPIRIIDVAVEK
jgi:hypothetical protein